MGRLKLVASVRERPPATASLTRSRNSYAVSPQLWTTNESNLRNYLFNKISTKNFVRNSLTCIFLYLVSNKEKTYAKCSKMLEIRSFEQKCLRTLFETRFPIFTLERIGSFTWFRTKIEEVVRRTKNECDSLNG